MTNLNRFIVLFLFFSLTLAGKIVGMSDESSSNQTISCPDRCNMNHGYCEPDGKCSCYRGWEGDDCNQCSLAPGCIHGTCDGPFQCNCKEGFRGRHCQLDLLYCERNQPCHNGATCTNDGNGSFTCTCRDGFIGKTCGFSTTPSSITRMPPSNSCLNGGTCIFGNNIVGCERCTCPKGYAGNRCESPVRMCITRPCANGGRCFDLINDFRCECARGYTGKHCTEDVDECSILKQGACENGGTCLNKQGSYSCLCPEGFEGVRCGKPTRRFIISRPPLYHTSTSTTTTRSTSLPSSTSTSVGHFSSVLNTLVDRKKPSFNDVAKSKSTTNIKVKIIKHVEVESSNVRIHSLIANDNLLSPKKEDTGEQASVSVVQAVTFAFLGVAVALFLSIALFLWLHCKKRKKRLPCFKSRKSSEERFIEGEEEDRERLSSIVRKEPPKYEQVKKSIYQPKPGLVVRTVSPSRDQLVMKPRPHVDCLYVALPRNQVTSDVPSITSIDETNSLLERSKLSRSSNFYHYRR